MGTFTFSENLPDYFEASDFQKCFFCGGPFTPGSVIVYWNGVGHSVIALHSDCAARLAVHLCHDAVVAKHRRKGEPLPFGIGIL